MEKLPPNNINSSLKFWEIVAVKINLSELKQAAVFKRKPYLQKKVDNKYDSQGLTQSVDHDF